MATSKRKGAPASAGVRQKKFTRKEKSEQTKERWRVGQAAARARIQAEKPQVPDRVHKTGTRSNPEVLVEHTGRPGRPPVAYNDELDAQLFDLIVAGLSLEKISRLPNMPSVPTLLKWVGQKDHKFSETYTRAKALLVPLYEERAIDAATDPQSGIVRTLGQRLTKNGDVVDIEEERYGDNVERSKLAVVTYQWALGWLVPKKHGRQADPSANQPNEQLAALFASLKSGPVE